MIAKTEKQPKCSPTDDGINKIGISIHGFYLGIKINEVTDICFEMDKHSKYLLSERNLLQKTTYYMIPSLRNIQNRKTYIEKKISGCQGAGAC